MPSRNWKDIAELIGIGAIVASLIFVGLQMQQSQDIAIGAQYQERANAAVEDYMSQVQSDQALRIWGQRLIDAASSDSYPIVIKNLIETAGLLREAGAGSSNLLTPTNHQDRFVPTEPPAVFCRKWAHRLLY